MRYVLAAAAVTVAFGLGWSSSTASAGLKGRLTTHSSCTAVTQSGAGLQQFVDRLRPGDVGCLAQGDYAVRRLILKQPGSGASPITLMSLDSRRPATIHGVVWLSDSADYWIVAGLRFDGRNPWNLPSPIVNGDHSIWRSDDFSNRGSGDGTQPYGGSICFSLGQLDHYGYATDTTIERNRIHDCGISNNENHGIYAVATSGRTIIRNNWIFRNGDRGIQLYPDAQDVLITHNVIDSNGSGVIFSGHNQLTSRNILVARNIISNSVKRWNVESWYPAGTPVGTRNMVRENCLWAQSPEPFYDRDGGISPRIGFVLGRGNVIQRPTFTAAGRGNYSLVRHSGCRGFGPVASPPTW